MYHVAVVAPAGTATSMDPAPTSAAPAEAIATVGLLPVMRTTSPPAGAAAPRPSVTASCSPAPTTPPPVNIVNAGEVTVVVTDAAAVAVNPGIVTLTSDVPAASAS